MVRFAAKRVSYSYNSDEEEEEENDDASDDEDYGSAKKKKKASPAKKKAKGRGVRVAKTPRNKVSRSIHTFLPSSPLTWGKK